MQNFLRNLIKYNRCLEIRTLKNQPIDVNIFDDIPTARPKTRSGRFLKS